MEGISVRQRDGSGKKNYTEVTGDGETLIISAPYPPLKPQKVRPFRQYLTVDGTINGSNDMGIDGSVTNQDFFIPATTDYDRYITTLNILIGYGTSSQPFKFADVVALANGCRLFYNSYRGEVDIHEGLKSNQDFFRLKPDSIDSNWEVRGVNANNDYGYTTVMDLTKMGLPFGIKLDRGTTQRLCLTIKDNCADADSFNIIGYGFERFE